MSRERQAWANQALEYAFRELDQPPQDWLITDGVEPAEIETEDEVIKRAMGTAELVDLPGYKSRVMAAELVTYAFRLANPALAADGIPMTDAHKKFSAAALIDADADAAYLSAIVIEPARAISLMDLPVTEALGHLMLAYPELEEYDGRSLAVIARNLKRQKEFGLF